MREFRYAIVGNGAWGKVITEILRSLCREVTTIELSRKSNEQSETEFKNIVRSKFREVSRHVKILWLAVPPGNQATLIEEALLLGFHVIVEKPLVLDASETHKLQQLANVKRLQVGVHYQYCYLTEFYNLQNSEQFPNKATFSGIFDIEKKNRFNISAGVNLASHLFAIKLMHFQNTSFGSITASYQNINKRCVNIHTNNRQHIIDFTNNNEPLIQRFIADFEYSIIEHYPFLINLKFSENVINDVTQHYKRYIPTR